MTFDTSKKLDQWVKEHNKICKSHATAGEHYVWEFLPTGIVECQTVKCLVCKEEHTEYVD